MVFKTLIIDDEIKAIQRMERIVSKKAYIELKGTFTSPEDAFEYIKRHDVNLIFLDIEMPKMSGIELAESIFEIKPEIDIIFITAYDKYALEAFQVHAIGYLLKPIEEEEVDEQISRLLRKRKQSLEKQPSMELQINCFGGFHCYTLPDKKLLKWRTAKSEELFALLIHYEGKEVSKERIIDFLYGDMTVERASTNLHANSYYVRECLKPLGLDQCFIRKQGKYCVDLQNIHCDYLDWKNQLEVMNIFQCSLEKLNELAAYNDGSYFEGRDYQWSLETVHWIEQRFEEIDFQRVKIWIEKDQIQEAIQILQKMLVRNPVLEEAYFILIRLYKHIKNEVAAKRWYTMYESKLLSEIGELPQLEFKDIN